MDDDLLFRFLTKQATQAEEAAVTTWRAAAPQNDVLVQQLAKVLALTREADGRLAGGTAPSAEQIVARAQAPVASRWLARVRGLWPASVAAAVALTLLGSLWWRSWAVRAAPELRMQEIATGRQETATIALADGSVIHLGPGSRLRVRSERAGEVYLDGHAYFAVAQQKGRPLRIGTPAGEVKVVGTRFDLEASTARLRLTVLEGRVLLSGGGPETAVNAGEQARIVEGLRLPVIRLRPEDIRLEWLGNFLAFQHTPLANAAGEIERQFKVRVRIDDPALASQTITGWFSGWPLEAVVDVVCTVTHAECTIRPGVVIMRAKRVDTSTEP